jgi:hypothetical protein
VPLSSPIELAEKKKKRKEKKRKIKMGSIQITARKDIRWAYDCRVVSRETVKADQPPNARPGTRCILMVDMKN